MQSNVFSVNENTSSCDLHFIADGRVSGRVVGFGVVCLFHCDGVADIQVIVAGVDRPLFSHSYLGYGFDVIEARTVNLLKSSSRWHATDHVLHAHNATSQVLRDPCLPKG